MSTVGWRESSSVSRRNQWLVDMFVGIKSPFGELETFKGMLAHSKVNTLPAMKKVRASSLPVIPQQNVVFHVSPNQSVPAVLSPLSNCPPPTLPSPPAPSNRNKINHRKLKRTPKPIINLRLRKMHFEDVPMYQEEDCLG
ncbi:hypothetical protein GX48_00771 [Paracoccidioides brasiliensis]|nr:hypothetical protein GX48_00771 [Paracoccidioides brasiliensis]